MSQYLFGLYICYLCSGLHNTGELLCSLEYVQFLIGDFIVIVSFLKLSREEKGASGHPSSSLPRAWKAFVIHTALEIPRLMECCFKIYFYKWQVLRNESLSVMLLPGFARKEHESKRVRFQVIGSALAYLQLVSNVWMHLCQKRKAPITDRESLRQIQLGHHMKQTVSAVRRKKENNIFMKCWLSVKHSNHLPN